MCHDRSRKFLRPEIWHRIWRGDIGFKCVGDGSLVGDDVTFLLCPGGSALTWLHLFVFNLEVINIKRQVICFIADWVDAQLRISTIKVFLHYVKVFAALAKWDTITITFIRVSNTWLGGQSWIVKSSDWAPWMAVESVKLEGGHKFGHSWWGVSLCRSLCLKLSDESGVTGLNSGFIFVLLFFCSLTV